MLEKNKILEMIIKGYAEQVGNRIAMIPFNTQQDAATVAAAVVDQLVNSRDAEADPVVPARPFVAEAGKVYTGADIIAAKKAHDRRANGATSETAKKAHDRIAPKLGDNVTVNLVYKIKSAIEADNHHQRAYRVFNAARKLSFDLPVVTGCNLVDRIRGILKGQTSEEAFIAASPEQLDRIERLIKRFYLITTAATPRTGKH